MRIHSTKTKLLSLVLAMAMLVPMLVQAMAFAVEEIGSGETEQSEYADAIGSTAKFVDDTVFLFSDPKNNVIDQVIPLGGSMPELVTIIDYYSGSELYYKIDAAEGYTWPEDYANYHYVKASLLEIISSGEEDEEKPVEVTVDGAPEGTELAVEKIDEEKSAVVLESIIDIDWFTEGGFKLHAFDIKLMDKDNQSVQPDGSVKLTLSNIVDSAWKSPTVIVYHLLDSADAIAAAVNDGTARATDDEAVLAAYPEEAKMAAEAGYEGIVAYTVLCTSDETVTINDDGSITFATDSFSDYYIASGDLSDGNKEDRGQIANNTNDTYYTMPGTTLYFYVDTNNNVTWTATLPNGITGASGNNIEYENHPAYRVTIPQNFVPAVGGTTFTLTASWSHTSGGINIPGIGNIGGTTTNYSGEVKIVVLSQQEFISKILTAPGDNDDTLDENDEYPVYIAILKNSATSTGTPNEPGQSGAGYNFIEDGYTTGTNKSDVFHGPNGNGIINPDIGSHADFQISVDGTNTVGLVDATGVKTKAMLTGIDWDRVKEAIFEIDEIRYDTDGDVVVKNNPDDYEVIPYVIKLETTNDMQGWHIDCAIRKKASVTLIYDNNIPSGMQLNTSIALPNNVTIKQGNTVTVGTITGMSNGSVEISNIQNPDEKYTLTFQGWNTKPDGTGTTYQPNDPITLNENTTLYAMWNSNPAMGTGDLKIEKKVVAAGGGTIDTDQEFTFTVNISNAGDGDTYRYTIYNANNVAVSGGTGTIASGDMVKLKHGQFVIIEDVPAVNDENGTPNVTITETAVDGYTASWSNSEANDASTSVKIEGGRRSEVTCTNTAVEKKGSLTIKKDGWKDIDDNQTFIFHVSGKDFELDVTIHGKGSVTIEGLIVGETYTVTEKTDWSWRYSPDSNDQEVILDADATKNEVTFTNTRSEKSDEDGNWKWLDGNAWADNLFE